MTSSPIMRSSFSEIGNDVDPGHLVQAKLGRKQPGVLIDSFATNDVDLDDLEHFVKTPGKDHPNEMTQGEQLIHILAERRAAVTSAHPDDFGPAHAKATAVHNQYRAELGQSPEVSATAAPDGRGGLTGTTSYRDGTSLGVQFNANGVLSCAGHRETAPGAPARLEMTI